LEIFPNDNLQNEFDKYCVYNLITRFLHRQRIDKIYPLINDRGEGLNLDAGCSSGVYAMKMGEDTVGLDISEDGLIVANRWAKERGIKKINFIQADIENLPFKSKKFNFVVSSEVIEHLEHPMKGLLELKRIMKSGGTLIVSVPNSLSLLQKWNELKVKFKIKALENNSSIKEDHPHGEWPVSFTVKMIRKVNLKIEKIKSTYINPLLFFFLRLYKIEFLVKFSDKIDKILGNIPFIKYLGAFIIIKCRKK